MKLYINYSGNISHILPCFHTGKILNYVLLGTQLILSNLLTSFVYHQMTECNYKPKEQIGRSKNKRLKYFTKNITDNYSS